MARSINGNFIGRAAQTVRRDLANDIQDAREKFSEKWNQAVQSAEYFLGDNFDTWFDSYDENMSKRDFLPIMEDKIKVEVKAYETMIGIQEGCGNDTHDLLASMR